MKRGRGQRVGLTRERVLDAAMTLVDCDGLAALSMRRLGSELGFKAMTLYHHVPNKDALLNGLVERLLVGASDALLTDDSWQGALRGFARSWLDALRAHPHLVPVVLSRPAVTAQNLALIERVLQRLHQAGFPPSRALDIVYAVAGLVVGQAATPTIDPVGADQARVLSDADLRDFPLLADAARANRAEPGDRFEFALDAMLRFPNPPRRAGRRCGAGIGLTLQSVLGRCSPYERCPLPGSRACAGSASTRDQPGHLRHADVRHVRRA